MKSLILFVVALATGGAAAFCGLAAGLIAVEFAVPALLNLAAAILLARRADREAPCVQP